MFILTIAFVGAVLVLAYFAYRYSDSLVEIARLESILEEKETVINALQSHVSKLDSDLDEALNAKKSIASDLKACTEKAAKAKKAAKVNATVAAPVIKASSKKAYNKKSK